MKNLQKQYEKVCNEYIKEFCNKQKLKFNYWINGIVGGTAYFYGKEGAEESFYFNFHDIVWDINSNQPTELILKWYLQILCHPHKAPNYYSHTQVLTSKKY